VQLDLSYSSGGAITGHSGLKLFLDCPEIVSIDTALFHFDFSSIGTTQGQSAMAFTGCRDAAFCRDRNVNVQSRNFESAFLSRWIIGLRHLLMFSNCDYIVQAL
jgi:hypothetical protein